MLYLLIESRLKAAVAELLPDANLSLISVKPCPDPKFGDYQTSALMGLAKQRKLNPRQLATDVLARLKLTDICDAVDIAGAGFLNFRIKSSALCSTLQEAVQGKHLFYQSAAKPLTFVVDFSSPNVAKPMHVGHIRSTVLGECLSRNLRLLGHRVITDNHIGDWGTQFGKLIVGWKRHLDQAALEKDAIAEMERLYKLVNSASEADAAVADEARAELVKLQQGDETNLEIWRRMIALSQHQFDTLYGRLGVKFDHTYGESFYNEALQPLAADLLQKGISRESDGAQVIFYEEIPELKAQPAVVLKSDGAANYLTTDLATIAYRTRTWQPDEILYVTDGRQQLHFKQLFAAYRKWQPEATVKLQHVWFGAILGEDGKPFKTRSGDTVRLSELLNEAEERALTAVTEKNPDLPEAQRKEIARVVGLGAVKYADLLPNRQSDYVFSWDKMLALTGNTAPYLLYAYTRVRSIFRKVESTDLAPASELILVTADELTLAKHLLNFGLTLQAVAEECRPNYLCNYLFELAGHFARFYESSPVLKSTGVERASRLALCDLTGRVLKQGLEILGIETTEQM